MKITVISILLIISINLTSGCFENDKNISDFDKLIGTWKWNGESVEITFSFYENQTFYSYSVVLDTQKIHKGWGTFYFNNSKLCMYSPDGISGGPETNCYNYSYSENNKKLTLSTAEFGELILLKV